MNGNDSNEKKPFVQMTLRDYFAAKALGGIMAGDWDVSERRAAEIAYMYADFMIEARKKKP